MARITVEDSLKMAKNRFALVTLASRRTKQLFNGSKVLTDRTENREIVTALREIAAGNVGYSHPEYLRRSGEDEEYIENTTESVDSEEKSAQ